MDRDAPRDSSDDVLTGTGEGEGRVGAGPAAAGPIAIVGMACRFPGADDIAAFWRLLEDGRNTVQEGVPGSGVGRIGALFPEDTGQIEACRFGAYLEGLDRFDASFFRISPVEAELLDPQQRLLLETSWRALEDAGIDPELLKDSRTGVYAGISNNDYRGLILESGRDAGPTEPAASLYTVTGTSLNTAIGRVAFALGLGGPAMAVDTACSSSLVATHQAVTGLQRGDADLALAGGVNVILSGRLLEFRANAGMLSPDGQCKTFDASANGYVRGEGCGIVVLKRLADAEADGDRIWGVIRGTALNQDGASQGLTVPNGAAQERVIAAALERAGVRASDIDYLEAHGTGTEVGDPIEIDATAAVYSHGRDADRPLLIGSVKTNIGHLESAAGVAGLIKTVLALSRGRIPRHLHFQTPNPDMDWERLPLQVTSVPTPWPDHAGRPPLAGVSGFGWSGTNAHIVLEGYGSPDGGASAPDEDLRPAGIPKPIAASVPATPLQPRDGLGPRTTRLLPLSGKSGAALRDAAGLYLEWLDRPETTPGSGCAASDPLLSDMAWSAGIGRSHFGHRSGVAFRDAESLRSGLRVIAEADERPALRKASQVAFVYTGQASQWPGMGAALYDSEPVVRAVLDRCDAVLDEERGASLLDVMFGRPGAAGDLDDPQWKQPAIYALECALTALWSSLGIRPDAVLGHSLGEIAAAHAAGVFDLEDGLRLAAVRGSLVGALPGEGAMAAVFAPPARVAEALDAHNAAAPGIGLCIAADNGAHQVISGPAADIAAILDHLEAAGVRVARLRRSPAYHSAMIEPALDDLEAALLQLDFAPPSIPFVSNLTGMTIGSGETLGAAYWRRQMRAPVAFRACVETLAGLGTDAVVEIGPHAVLGPMVSMAWPSGVAEPAVVSSLRRPATGEESPAPGSGGGFVEAVAGVYEAGLPLRFDGLFAGESRRRISLPGYPFQRERYWVEAPQRRRQARGHPLLGNRHESASGETAFDTEVFPTDPAWLSDHRVFGRSIAPGALFGAMAASACRAEGDDAVIVEDFNIQSALVFARESGDDGAGDPGRRVQVLLDAGGDHPSRRVRILSRVADDEEWTLHAEGQVSSGAAGSTEAPSRLDTDGLKAGLSQVDLPAFYRAKSAVGIDLGASFRTVTGLWARDNEALGEVALPAGQERGPVAVHPLVLDGCFQIMGAARDPHGTQDGTTYLPFAWERLWLRDGLPDRLFCHVTMRESPRDAAADVQDAGAPEVHAADMRLYDGSGELLGELTGFTVKRATRAALLAAVEGVDELLYEIAWRDCPLPAGMLPADFLPAPSAAAARSHPFSRYLDDEGVAVAAEVDLQGEMERVSWCYALSALETLGWERSAGAVVEPEELRERLEVLPEHAHLLRRHLEILARSGVLEEKDGGYTVLAGRDDALPDGMPGNAESFLAEVTERFPHAANEIGLFRRCAGALPEVLRGREDPLALLFGDAEPSAGALYRLAPVWRAANRMIGEVVRTLVDDVPDGRRLRVLEVGAGIGSATEYILPELPAGGFDYMYTDISAGFFADAESRFSAAGTSIDYRMLDIEKDPADQGFELHAYDMLIAANVLHATRHLDETLAHCRALLAPSGLLVALENQRGRGWMDLIFGQLDGWWRFDDRYRTNHALAGPDVWHAALADTGFAESAVLGVDPSDSALPDRGVIVAQGPAKIDLPEGVWILAADRGGMAASLAAELAAQNQRVVLAGDDPEIRGAAVACGAGGDTGIVTAPVSMERREAWQSLVESLPPDVPFAGAVHLVGQDGHGAESTTADMAADAKRTAASALALVQGIADADAVPEKGLWFVTRGAQVLERERIGQLAGATLWGLGKVVLREAPQLQARMLDLDPEAPEPGAVLANELLFPDSENHIAHRRDRRQVARMVRTGAGAARLALPDETSWVLAPDEGGAIETLQVQPLAPRTLEPNEVRVAVDACGLNFLDVFRSMGLVEEGLLGEEFCGRIVATGSDVTAVSPGDRVAGFAFGTFGPEVVTHEELIAPAPPGMSAAALATVPSVFVTCVLSYELAGLKAGDRVLVHAGAGGVGLAAIQLAMAAGAEVFATASAPKQDYLRSLGVEHVFDSRSIAFGRDIRDATTGAGVDIVLNSLTGEGFIEASLSCLARGGRFVELARRDILSEDEMAALRPDVAYSILDLYVLKQQDPARPGAALREVLARMEAGELAPLRHTRWPLAETSAAMGFMRAARHIGKIVLTTPPFEAGRLKQDGTYLVTGGLGGIGCALAEWLVEHGAGTVVLNGRRPPDPEAEQAIEALRVRGFRVEVEIADVTETAALDAMLARMDEAFPPLVGVIHSVGVLADAALGNQSWESFETVLWPKMLGAWRLHRATAERDLDMFVLFSSVAGVLGNPGQANHAAANAFLDQLAAHRRALGLPGQAIAWGAWAELGEAEEQRARIAGRREASGTGWFTPEHGFKAFELLVRRDATSTAVAVVDWPVFGNALGDRPPLLEDLLAGDTDEEEGSSSSEDLLAQLGATPAAGREDLLASFLQREIQAVLRLPSAPSPAVGFFDLGMDSLMAVELRNRLNRVFSDTYAAPNTLVFDYPTIADLARHLVDVLGEPDPSPGEGQETGAASGPDPQPSPQPADGRRNDGIAIIGMACRFPGAPDIAAFWRQLEAGRDAVTNGRQDGGTWTGVAGDPAAGDNIWGRGGFVEEIDRFDARFFGMTPIGARMMDPQQRLLLETSWRAIEDAGIDPEDLRGSRTGVYAGIATSEYRDLMMASGDGLNYLGTASGMAVGGVAFKLGLTGPAVPVMVNCAASLVTVQQAVAGLRDGAVDLALVGGVNAVLSPGLTREMAALGMLSQQGRCKTFDAAADGFVRSEGCGMIVLKRLAEAEADGDRIWAVIRGAAVNQNGATAGPTTPNGPAQERVIEEALSQAGVQPSDVDYLEAHGAGSELGDPIEVQAAAAAYGRGRDGERPLLIGSVKTNVGHLESAAGVAALIKAVLAMRHGLIPKHLHFQQPNPHLDWDRLPVRVVSEATRWPSTPGRPPLAGVSAFGISGTNAHVVVEGYPSPDRDSPAPDGVPKPVPVSMPDTLAELPQTPDGLAARGTRLLPLSGKSASSLRELAERYLAWLDERESLLASDGAASGPALSDMAWTAGVGRSHFDHRAAVAFEDCGSLREGLQALATARAGLEPVTPARIAFAYGGIGSGWTGLAEALYASEPVVRTVLDRCEDLFGEMRRVSLLDVMFGRPGSAGDPGDPQWARPAAYVLECALTALWSAVGVRPGVVLGHGVGALAAAQAAGVLGLEDGLRLAAATDDPDAVTEKVTTGAATLTLVDTVSGLAVSPDDAGGATWWRRQVAAEPGSFGTCAGTLSAAGIGAIIGIGPDMALGAKLAAARPEAGDAAAPVILSSAGRTVDRGGVAKSRPDGGFAEAVAGAYEAGLAVSFAGLFGGETRRRVSLPDYPFERRRHWI